MQEPRTFRVILYLVPWSDLQLCTFIKILLQKSYDSASCIKVSKIFTLCFKILIYFEILSVINYSYGYHFGIWRSSYIVKLLTEYFWLHFRNHSVSLYKACPMSCKLYYNLLTKKEGAKMIWFQKIYKY